MLRSFSYAAAAAERALPNDITAEVRQAARTRLTHWNARASKVFADSYFSATEGISSVPPDRDDAQHLLRFFLLEKSLYEVAYEKANRPDWIGIPVDGVLSILDQD
jgi:maltose alpha-D-glucosyltransferase/alpha-amylase